MQDCVIQRVAHLSKNLKSESQSRHSDRPTERVQSNNNDPTWQLKSTTQYPGPKSDKELHRCDTQTPFLPTATLEGGNLGRLRGGGSIPRRIGESETSTATINLGFSPGLCVKGGFCCTLEFAMTGSHRRDETRGTL